MDVTQNYVIALIVKSQLCKIPEVVFPHQVTMLETMYGDVQTLNDEPPVKSGTFDTAEEYDRMKLMYGAERVENEWRKLKDFEACFVADAAEDDGDLDDLRNNARELGIKVDGRWNAKRLSEEIQAVA